MIMRKVKAVIIAYVKIFMYKYVPDWRKSFYVHFNRMIMSINGVKYGKNTQIFNSIYLRIINGGKLTIGDNFIFRSGGGNNPISRNIRGSIFIDRNGEIKIGDNTGISSACIRANRRIEIGDNVMIGGDCIIMDTDAHSLDWRIRAGLSKDKLGGGNK